MPTSSAEKEAQVAAAHRTALEKEQAEVARLRQELAKSQQEQAEMTKVMNEVTEAQETLVTDLQSRASLAENKLSVLTAKCDTWLAELQRINGQMDKFFSHSQHAAVQAVSKARGKRAHLGPISTEWDVEDHLIALNARLVPLKSIGVGLLDAGISVFRQLWPGIEPPKNVPELAEELRKAELRLREWRSSAARAGADQALSFILSWYEEIDLDHVKTQRENSVWTTDPAKIQHRRESADYMAQYSRPHEFVPGPVYPDDDESDSDAGDAEEEPEEEEANPDEPTGADAEAGVPESAEHTPKSGTVATNLEEPTATVATSPAADTGPEATAVLKSATPDITTAAAASTPTSTPAAENA